MEVMVHSSAVVGEPSLVTEHGPCVSIVVSDLPPLHPRAVEGRVKLLVPKVGAVLIQFGSLQHSSSYMYIICAWTCVCMILVYGS